MADDSGLECDALDGDPGVYTARFAGEGATDSTNIDKLLAVLDEEENRKARFVAHITLVMENYEIHCEGTLDGEITRGRRGTNGFGYDPVFIPEGYDKTLAELDDEVKNSISHRRKAIEKMQKALSDLNLNV
jgi:XTP/dITP diphosphohydrolase